MLNVVPSGTLSSARPFSYSSTKFAAPGTRRGFIVGYISGIFTAIMITAMLLVPAGATAYAISEANEWESINVMREQTIPSSQDQN